MRVRDFVYLLSRESNRKGVGETLVSPWRKAGRSPSENRGFSRSEIAKRPAPATSIRKGALFVRLFLLLLRGEQANCFACVGNRKPEYLAYGENGERVFRHSFTGSEYLVRSA